MSLILNNYTQKINFYYNVIKNTFKACNLYKQYKILNSNDINQCIYNLENVNNLLKSIYDNENDIINVLQYVNNTLSNIIKQYGTYEIDDLISICFGKKELQKNLTNDYLLEKFNILSENCHPINYKIINWKQKNKKTDKLDKTDKIDNKKDKMEKIVKIDKIPLVKNRIIDDNMLVENADNLECFDLARTNQNFKIKINGLKFVLHNEELKQTIVIFCIIDDILPDCINYNIIRDKINDLHSLSFEDNVFDKSSWNKFIDTISLKDMLVYSIKELYDKYVGYINQINLLYQKTIYQIVQEFIGSELYTQRNIIIQLLLNSDKREYQYIAYLLYDILSNDSNGNIDTIEQVTILDSLPWKFKNYFKDAMAQTIIYTNDLSSFDNNKIPLEQQICLMKVNDYVKEKAMQKLKEVKAKSDDSCSKARQYLEGLLKIPFSIYKKEYIFNTKQDINNLYSKIQDILLNINKYTNNNDLLYLLSYKNYNSRYIEFIEENRDNNNINTISINNFIEYIENDINICNNLMFLITKDVDKIKKSNIVKYLNLTNKNIENNKKYLLKQDYSELKTTLIKYIYDNKDNPTNLNYILSQIYNNNTNNNNNNNKLYLYYYLSSILKIL